MIADLCWEFTLISSAPLAVTKQWIQKMDLKWSDLLMNRCCNLTTFFGFVFLAVGPYSLLIDICVTYNYNLSFISLLFKRRQRNRNSERIKITWCVCWLTEEETITLMNFFVLFRGLYQYEASIIVRDIPFLAMQMWL